MYTMGKARYLSKNGWIVNVFTYVRKSKTNFPDLEDYVIPLEGMCFLSVPPYKLNRFDRDFYLDLMIQRLKLPKDISNCEIILESISSPVSYWGELLAAKIGGRHFVSLVEEHYRYPTSRHEENLEFFYFKWKRNELLVGKKALQELFNGYKNVHDTLVKIPHTIREQDAVQDINYPAIESITKLDWNICHIGRIVKNYVYYLIEGVAELARQHKDKKINFIFVGNVQERADLIIQTFKKLSNVNLILLGTLVPIPRCLFSKLDVVCGISQSARFAADEGVFTIVASAKNIAKTPGVLGYDTNEQIYGDPTFTYFEALENVLVKRLYDNKKSTLPRLKPAEEYYEKFWTIVKNANPNKEYCVEPFLQNRIRHWAAVFPFGSIARGSRIILFGATEIASDYKRQIESQFQQNLMDFGNFSVDSKDQQNFNIEIGPDGVKEIGNEPYCYVLATVDEHPENFDDSVVGFDRLKTLDYDAVLITTYTHKAREARKKIIEIVPQMADRIICNIQFFEVYLEKDKKHKYLDF